MFILYIINLYYINIIHKLKYLNLKCALTKLIRQLIIINLLIT